VHFFVTAWRKTCTGTAGCTNFTWRAWMSVRSASPGGVMSVGGAENFATGRQRVPAEPNTSSSEASTPKWLKLVHEQWWGSHQKTDVARRRQRMPRSLPPPAVTRAPKLSQRQACAGRAGGRWADEALSPRQRPARPGTGPTFGHGPFCEDAR